VTSAFTLVFVCTANRGRSPIAEGVVRLLSPANVVVSSVGIHTSAGLPPLPEAEAAARRLGIDIGGHRSQQLGARSLEQADLVVGFEQIHVATAVVEGGAPRPRTFTLPDLVQLLPQAPGTTGETAYAVVAHAAERRAGRTIAAGSVPDPVGRPQAVVDQIAVEIDALTRRLVNRLFGVG